MDAIRGGCEMKNIIMAILFVAGLLLAGSDGAYFPWPNMVGVAMIAVMTFLAGSEEQEE